MLLEIMVGLIFDVTWMDPPITAMCAWDGAQLANVKTPGRMLKVTRVQRNIRPFYQDHYFHDFRCLRAFAENEVLKLAITTMSPEVQALRASHAEVINFALAREPERPISEAGDD